MHIASNKSIALIGILSNGDPHTLAAPFFFPAAFPPVSLLKKDVLALAFPSGGSITSGMAHVAFTALISLHFFFHSVC